jgi:outer membrane protein assembly factor BamB
MLPPGLRGTAPFALAAAFAVLAFPGSGRADDWPQWMGPRRDGIWRETGIVDTLPAGGPPVRWRVPVNSGYCGPAVAAGRLFLVDRVAGKMAERVRGDRSIPQVPGNERIACLDAATGRLLWERTNDCPYRIAYPAGPRATPLVDADLVFTLGAMGDLRCHEVESGRPVWARRFVEEFRAEPPAWGWSAHPLLEGDRLFCTVGGEGSAVVAFDRRTGRELWRALTATEIGYAPPVLAEVGGRRQLIVWHPDALAGLDPATGQVLWTQPYPVGGKPQRPEVAIAAPQLAGNRLFVTSFYQGALLLELGADTPQPRVVWNRRSTKQSEFDQGLHTVMGTPVIRGDCIYGFCGFGELRCLDLATGDRRWSSSAVVGAEKAFFGNAFMVENAGRWFFFNDQGELVLGRMNPDGYVETGRARLVEPLETTRGRTVVWCHPAFARRSIFVHNGRELVCASLAAG